MFQVIPAGTLETCPEACPADVDASGDVGLTDLLATMTAWGSCAACSQDLDADGIVGFTDLLLVLVNWAWNYLSFRRAVRLILPDRGGPQ